MFGWGKKKQDDGERPAFVRQSREMFQGMKQNWDMPTQMTFAVLLANLWREFENKYGSPAAFAQIPEAKQSQYVGTLLAKSVQLNSQLEKLNKQRADKGTLTDALCQWAAVRLMGFYVLAIIAHDREWESDLAQGLDEYMVKGYKISWGSFRLPGDDARPPKGYRPFSALYSVKVQRATDRSPKGGYAVPFTRAGPER